MQLRLDAADRLVELVEERRGAVPVEEAALALFALRHLPEGMARSLLDDVVRDDARLAWRGGGVALAVSAAERVPLEEASFCVVDLETTGLSPTRSRICEIGAVRIEALELAGSFQTLVNQRERLPLEIARLTGIDDRELRRAPALGLATRRFLGFAADAALVAHNARFDLSFLDAAVLRLGDRRLAAPVVDTVWLARRVLAGRASRFGLASLAHFFGTAARPCHRALPDAEATAEILLRLIGLAQERGARTVGDLVALSAPRRRRVYGKRSLAFGAPTRPGVYLFRDRAGQVLYVGRARDLRAPANARSTRPDRYVYLGVRGDQVVVTRTPSATGPVKSRRRAELVARALEPDELARPRDAVPRLRRKLARLAEDFRYEDAARLRDRLKAVEAFADELERLVRLRAAELCLLAPAVEPGFRRAFFVKGGRVAAARTIGPGGG